jgi:hypothetical protein
MNLNSECRALANLQAAASHHSHCHCGCDPGGMSTPGHDDDHTEYRVRSRSLRNCGGGTKLGRIICRSATLHNQTASPGRSSAARPGA